MSEKGESKKKDIFVYYFFAVAFSLSLFVP